MLSRNPFGPIAFVAATLAATGALAFDETKYPDWSGQWRRIEGGPPRYDMSKPPGRGQQRRRQRDRAERIPRRHEPSPCSGGPTAGYFTAPSKYRRSGGAWPFLAGIR